MTISAAPTTPLAQQAPQNALELRKRVDRILAPLQARSDAGTITVAATQLVGELAKLPLDTQCTMMYHVVTDVAKGTNEHSKRLIEENRRLKEPPRRVAALEEVRTDAGGRPVATVGTRDGMLEVPVSVEVKVDELRPGQRVILAPNGAVIDGRGAAPANPLCEFDTLLADGRIMARLENGHRLVLLPGWDLQTRDSLGKLNPGDLLEYEPVTQQALRLAQSSARIQEFLGETPDVAREDIGGVDEIWPQIEQKVISPILFPELYAKYGLGTPRGMLFYGPPGVGKTMLIKAAARAVLSALGNDGNAPVLFAIPGASLLRPYVGEGNGLLRAIAKAAEKAASEHGFAVILLDDFEYAGGLHRGLADRSTPAHSSLTQSLLAEMDGLGSRGSRVTWMATTNRPDLLDTALNRPGRFGMRISVPRPGPDGCRQIARVHLTGRPLARELSAEQAAEAMADRIFAATDDNLLLRINYADSGQEEVFAPRLISGAIIGAAVTDAAQRAVSREIAKEPGGLRLDDLLTCLDAHLRSAVAHITPANVRHYYLNLPDDRAVASVEQVQLPLQGSQQSFVA
jgi:proteasome-associated ATPase